MKLWQKQSAWKNRVGSSEGAAPFCFLFSQYNRDALKELTCDLKAL